MADFGLVGSKWPLSLFNIIPSAQAAAVFSPS